MSASSKFARSERPNRAFNARWNFFRPITSASPIDEDKKTLTLTSSPACPSLPLTRTSLALPLTDSDDLGVYIIRACGLTTHSCPVPGVGLDGLALSPDIPVLGGLAPSPDISVSGGLPLTQDDFREHRAPLPSQSMTARPRRFCAPPPQAPPTTYAISACDDTPRPSRRTRNQTAISAGQTPSRPVYRKAAHSGFARPPLQRLLRPARRRLRVRIAWATQKLRMAASRLDRRRLLLTFGPPLDHLRRPCTLQRRILTSKLQRPIFLTLS